VDGPGDGLSLGVMLGAEDGWRVGPPEPRVGFSLASGVGLNEGSTDGCWDGIEDGFEDGFEDGSEDASKQYV
jgi:hypothetical protein